MLAWRRWRLSAALPPPCRLRTCQTLTAGQTLTSDQRLTGGQNFDQRSAGDRLTAGRPEINVFFLPLIKLLTRAQRFLTTGQMRGWSWGGGAAGCARRRALTLV